MQSCTLENIEHAMDTDVFKASNEACVLVSAWPTRLAVPHVGNMKASETILVNDAFVTTCARHSCERRIDHGKQRVKKVFDMALPRSPTGTVAVMWFS